MECNEQMNSIDECLRKRGESEEEDNSLVIKSFHLGYKCISFLLSLLYLISFITVFQRLKYLK